MFFIQSPATRGAFFVSLLFNYSNGKICSKCGEINWGFWTSASNGKISRYCKTCRQLRAKSYSLRVEKAFGKHTRKEWIDKLGQHEVCPKCLRRWSEIPLRPDKRYKNVWTKDHIVPLNKGGRNDISNIQPLCYQCNFGKR